MNEEQKRAAFVAAIDELRENLIEEFKGGPIDRAEQLNIFDKVIDTWHVPTVRAYNLLYPQYETPYWARMSQWEYARTWPDNQVWFLLAAPHQFMQIDKDELWKNRLFEQEGRDAPTE